MRLLGALVGAFVGWWSVAIYTLVADVNVGNAIGICLIGVGAVAGYWLEGRHQRFERRSK